MSSLNNVLKKEINSSAISIGLVSHCPLGSDSWNNTQSISYWFRSINRSHGVQLNGVLHWLGVFGKTTTEVIVSFDVSNERIADLPLPEEIMLLSLLRKTKTVGVLGKCLCLLVDMHCSECDMWVMQNYKVKESWAKQFTITEGLKCCYQL